MAILSMHCLEEQLKLLGELGRSDLFCHGTFAIITQVSTNTQKQMLSCLATKNSTEQNIPTQEVSDSDYYKQHTD